MYVNNWMLECANYDFRCSCGIVLVWFHYLFLVKLLYWCENWFVPFFSSKLKKLSEDSLTKQPEEVFDVLEKLGEG